MFFKEESTVTDRILLVDDEPEIREILAELFEDEGFQVVQAEDGEIALQKFMSEDFDLVVSDVRMPNKSGIELLRDIKQSGQEVDVIILTGQSDELTAIDCLKAGAYDYLLKPIDDLEIMLTSVNRALEKRELSKRNKKLMEQLEELAVRDPLTGLYNMRPFYQFVDSEIRYCEEQSKQFGVLFIDIDHFKQINDQFGHQFGDQVLKMFAKLLKSELKEFNKFFRYGGEEFVIMLPDTDTDEAQSVAMRVLNVVRKHDFSYQGNSTRLTVSIGGAVYPVDAIEQVELVKLADQALYKAKESGRDCYVHSSSGSVYR